MPLKNKNKNKNKRVRNKDNSGLAKLASITTKSISSAYLNYKKNQEQKKIKEIKLKKLQENNNIIKEKKELKTWEERLKKEDNKIKAKEEELKIKEKQGCWNIWNRYKKTCQNNQRRWCSEMYNH